MIRISSIGKQISCRSAAKLQRTALLETFSLSTASPQLDATSLNRSEIKLKNVPSVPIFGSAIPFVSGLKLEENDLLGFWRDMHRRFGPFYSVGLPGLGKGVNGTCYFVRDPIEMMKVLKQEGSFPSGIIQAQWPIISWLTKKNYSTVGFYSRGQEWKRIRSFLQKDILSPMSAKEYLPGILRGAALASPKAVDFEDDIERFLNFAATDMFANVLFGNNEGMSEEDYRTFCEVGVEVLSEVVQMTRSAYENAAYFSGAFQTVRVRKFHDNMDIVNGIAQKQLRSVLKRIEEGNVTEDEKQSYFYKAILRQPGSEVTQEEVIQMCMILMLASVDTTASMMSWNILQLGLNQHVQDELYQQIYQAVQREGGLTPAIFENSQIPLLQAFIRETHRCTPSTPLDLFKEVSLPTTVYGVTLPAGSIIGFDSQTASMDPSIVDDPLTFRPERWFPEAVKARQGTPAALMDHTFFSGPFSQGARRCPGSRVAYLEIQVMLAQLLLDYRIESPTSMVHWKDVKSVFALLLTPHFPEGVRLARR